MKKIVLAALIAAPALASADQVFLDDLIVDGSACIGIDCANGESFGFDTIRLKENNLRMHFEDTSATASFPGNDWRFVFNDSGNGGKNFFAIEDASAGKYVFNVEAGAPTNALYVNAAGDVGIGTNSPVVEVQAVDGNTPTIRLEQDGSSGFTPHSWDIAANETNFFVRDVNNNSDLPFRIMPGTGDDNLVLKNGKVGVLTDNPAETLHIKLAGDAGVRLENTTATVGSTWRIYNQADSGKLKITDDSTGSRTPLKLEKEGTNNLMRIGRTTTVSGLQQNSMVEIDGTLKSTYLTDDSGNVYKLSDIVNALNSLGQNLPTYQ